MSSSAGLIVVAIFTFSGFAFAQAENVGQTSITTLKVYKTQRYGEMKSTLPLPRSIRTPQGKGLQEKYEVVFSVAIEDLSERDVLQISAEMEATNDCGYNIALGTWLMISNDSARTVPESARGEAYLSYPSGFNITPDMHHGFATRSTTFVIPKGVTGRRHINFVAYAQTDRFDCKKGNGLLVEKGNGQMTVLHFIGKR